MLVWDVCCRYKEGKWLSPAGGTGTNKGSKLLLCDRTENMDSKSSVVAHKPMCYDDFQSNTFHSVLRRRRKAHNSGTATILASAFNEMYSGLWSTLLLEADLWNVGTTEPGLLAAFAAFSHTSGQVSLLQNVSVLDYGIFSFLNIFIYIFRYL